MPTADLLPDAARSGVGRLSKHPDVAVLIVVLVFGALCQCGGNGGPVVAWHEELDQLLGQSSPLFVTSLFYAAAIVVLPMLAVGLAAILSRRWGQLTASRIEVATRFTYALVPLGFGMWLAHYSFHFMTSCDTIVPAATRFLNDLGLTTAEPNWVAGCCRPLAESPLRLEIMFLDLGLLLSLYIGYRIAERESPSPSRALCTFAPGPCSSGCCSRRESGSSANKCKCAARCRPKPDGPCSPFGSADLRTTGIFPTIAETVLILFGDSPLFDATGRISSRCVSACTIIGEKSCPW